MPANGLKIENPCPFLLSRMEQKDSIFFCSSCSKKIIDFRGKSENEIKCSIKTDTYGIFNLDQLQGQQKMPFWRQTVFFGMMVLSFLGFQVKPLYAQTIKTSAPQQKIENLDKKPDKKSKKEKKKAKKKKKTTPIRIIGTPSF